MQIPVILIEIPIPKANESHENVKISRVMNHICDVCVFAMYSQGVGGREDNLKLTCPRPRVWPKYFYFQKRKLLQVLSSKIRKVFIKNSRTIPETPLFTVKLRLDIHL